MTYNINILKFILITLLILGSTSSLIAGLAFGCILGYGAYQTSIDEKNFLLSLSKLFFPPLLNIYIYKKSSSLSVQY